MVWGTITKIGEPNSTACEYGAIGEKSNGNKWVGGEFARRLPKGGNDEADAANDQHGNYTGVVPSALALVANVKGMRINEIAAESNSRPSDLFRTTYLLPLSRTSGPARGFEGDGAALQPFSYSGTEREPTAERRLAERWSRFHSPVSKSCA